MPTVEAAERRQPLAMQAIAWPLFWKPTIIEAWFFSSARMRQFGRSRPIVASAASLDT
jgi:hypothetical protein